MTWETVKLSDCCESIADGDHLPPPKAERGIPFVTIANIENNNFNFSDCMFVPEAYYAQLDDKRRARTNDILYSVVGSFGIPVLKRDDSPLVFQRHIAILRPDPEEVEPKFLYYVMLSREFFGKADSVAIGAAQRTITLTALRNMEVDLPPLATQQRIGGILSAYDDLIENARKQIRLLEESAQRLYKEWFIDLHFPGHESTPILDGLPQGWERKTLGETFTYIRGKSYTSEEIAGKGSTLLVNLKNIQPWGGYNRDAEKTFSGVIKEQHVLSQGDLIMSVTDMTPDRRLVGHVALVPRFREKAIFSMDLIKLIPVNISKAYLYATFRFGRLSYQVSPIANGTNVLHLNPEMVKQLEIVVPSQPIMERYEQFFWALQNKIETLNDQIFLAQEARDRLLPKLMSGEITV